MAIAFPRQLLPLRTDDTTKLTAVGLTADDGPGALFSSTARQLARDLDHFDVASGVRVGTATLDLLTVALAGWLDRGDELPKRAAARPRYEPLRGALLWNSRVVPDHELVQWAGRARSTKA